MRNLSKTFVSIILALSGLCLPLSADEAQEDQRLEKAIEVISNPETPGERINGVGINGVVAHGSTLY